MTTTTTTTTTTPEQQQDSSSPSYEQYQQQEEEERSALHAWRATGTRLAAAMKAVGPVSAQLSRRSTQRERRRSRPVLTSLTNTRPISPSRMALRVSRESFKTRVRAAGLQTKFISLSDKDMDVLEQMDQAEEEEQEEGGLSPRYTPPSSP